MIDMSSVAVIPKENFINNVNSRINLQEIPINALRQRCRHMLSVLLNPIKILPSEEGYPRDWRGIAHFAGLQSRYGPLLAGHQDPMAKVLELWSRQEDEPGNVAQLQKILGIIDRWDVIDDTNQLFHEDAESYLNAKLKSSSLVVNLPDELNSEHNVDTNILTVDDVIRAQSGLPPQQYDAFVLFADEDVQFATELIERMENSGFKLCEKLRDLIGGISFEHEAILRLISERCNRLIVIVSPAFLRSPANTFFVNFAQALGIEQRRRKILPCIYENCVLPPTLSFYFSLHYQKFGKLWNFWDKLEQSIINTPTENTIRPKLTNTKITITEIDSPKAINQPNKKLLAIQNKPEIKEKSSLRPLSPRVLTQHSNNLKPKTKILLKKSLSPQPEKKFMPPLPRLRTASSMRDLSNVSSEMEKDSEKSKSTLYLDKTLSPEPSTVGSLKKPKWYKKLLSPNTKQNNKEKEFDNISSDGEKKSKKKWFKKKVAINS